MNNKRKNNPAKYFTFLSIGCGCVAAIFFSVYLMFFYAYVYSESGVLADILTWSATLTFWAALIFGFLALIKIFQIGIRETGSLLKIGSLFFSALLLMAILLSAFHAAAEKRGDVMFGEYQLEKLYRAILYYAKVNSDRLPVADKWCDLLMEHNEQLSQRDFRLPRRHGVECNFMFNENLSGLCLSDIHPQTVIIVKAKGNWNLHGGSELVQAYLKDAIDTLVLLQNGQIRRYDPPTFVDANSPIVDLYVNKQKLRKLRWQP